MAHVHFTLDREGLRDQETSVDEESMWNQVDNVSWPMDIALGPSKRGGSSAKVGVVASNSVPIGYL
jgi:hypothetical protein